MPITVVAVLSVHVLVAVFWAGATFSLARLAGLGGEKFVFPQLGAATLASGDAASGETVETMNPATGKVLSPQEGHQGSRGRGS